MIQIAHIKRIGILIGDSFEWYFQLNSNPPFQFGEESTFFLTPLMEIKVGDFRKELILGLEENELSGRLENGKTISKKLMIR